MPRVCSVCAHPERLEIDRTLTGETNTYRTIANRFGCSIPALKRHRKEHIPGTLAQAAHVAAVVEAGTLLQQVEGLRDRALALLDRAEDAGDLRTALAGVREARACIELLLEVEGELERRNVTNIVLSTDWLEIRSTIVSTLAPYPDAACAVIAGLVSLEGGKHAG